LAMAPDIGKEGF